MVIHHCLPFADERRSVKCLGSAAGVSFPSPPLPPAPTFLLLFAQCPRALAPLGLKEKETTATQARHAAMPFDVLLGFPGNRGDGHGYGLSLPRLPSWWYSEILKREASQDFSYGY